jgi:hypothetical protein
MRMVGISGAYSSLHVTQPLKAAQQNASSNVLSSASSSDNELTEAEEKEVQELKKIDAEVKAHEQAHATIGGPYAGSPQYQYTKGPDGNRYAVSGEVPIDASAVPNNPDATIRKMDIVIRAALAPAEPSAQDKQVAQQAQSTRLQAQIEKREIEQQQTAKENGESQTVTSSNPLEALINAALEFSKQEGEQTNAKPPSSSLLNQAISGYTKAASLAQNAISPPFEANA